VFGFCIAAGETNLMRTFLQSAILSSGTKMHLLGIFVVLLVLNVLGTSLLGLGLFITVPLSVLMMTAVYRQPSTC
jgi:hypothetical protein